MILGKKTALVALCAFFGVVAACAQAAPVCPPPPPPAPCDRDLAPLASAPKPVIDDPVRPKDAEAPLVAVEPDAGTPSADAQAPVANAKDGGPANVAAAAPKAQPRPASADPASCGTKDNLCPLQKLMRGEMAGASTGPALAAAFSHTANLSPNGGWSWRAISMKGAELAKAGDTAGAKQQCKACHDAYKESYKSTYRARAVR